MEKIEISKRDEKIFERLNKQGALGKRGLYIFQYLFLRPDFHKLVKDLRKESGIPDEGYDLSKKEDEEKVKKDFIAGGFVDWDRIFNTKVSLDVNIRGKIEDYIYQCGLEKVMPIMDLADGFIISLISEYVLLNDFIGFYRRSFGLATIEYYEGMQANHTDQDCRELRFSIPLSAKKEEIKEYFDLVWDDILRAKQENLTEKDNVRFRPRPNFIRDLKIYNKYIEIENMSVSQRKEEQISYIELGVIRKLKEDGWKDEEIPNDGTIRSIVNKLKNEIKDKSAFWEEIEEEDLSEPSKDIDFDEF